jgi:hypothetical protein
MRAFSKLLSFFRMHWQVTDRMSFLCMDADYERKTSFSSGFTWK